LLGLILLASDGERPDHAPLEIRTTGGEIAVANLYNVTDILISYEVNRGRGTFIHGGAKQATQPGAQEFPYVRPPNVKPFVVAQSVGLAASGDDVWKVVGRFDGLADWHPLIVQSKSVGSRLGQLREILTADGTEIVDRLEELDRARRLVGYSMVSGLPASDFTENLQVQKKGEGCTVEWRISYRIKGQSTPSLYGAVSTIVSAGLDGLKWRFCAAQ
jgi:hypothetical protein